MVAAATATRAHPALTRAGGVLRGAQAFLAATMGGTTGSHIVVIMPVRLDTLVTVAPLGVKRPIQVHSFSSTPPPPPPPAVFHSAAYE